MLYYGDTFEVDGNTFKVVFPYDEAFELPWERDDGHGPVREAGRIGYHGRPHKDPGEMLLGDYWIYDFAEACKTARRDGRGTLPGKLVTRQDADGLWHASVVTTGRYRGPKLEGRHVDVNKAIHAVYAAYRETFPSARAYAAAAAMADYDRLRRWCDDQWRYVGVVVELCDDDGDPVPGYDASLWGIESDADDYLEEVAFELADEIISRFESFVA